MNTATTTTLWNVVTCGKRGYGLECRGRLYGTSNDRRAIEFLQRKMEQHQKLTETLRWIASRIDEKSGAPTFTADEHEALEKLLGSC